MQSSREQLNRLLEGAAGGDKAAFAELYQATSAKLFAVALRIVRDREVAEDVLQDAYFRVWERAQSFDPKLASPITWMAAIVRNRCLDEIRRRMARPVVHDANIETIEGDDEHPLEALGRQEDVQRLLRCLDLLEPEKKQIVRLAYLDGLSRDALAKQFSRPEGTIKTWLRRSLAQLKSCLER